MGDGQEEDADSSSESDHEEDEEKDDLDTAKEVSSGWRRSTRKRKQQDMFGYVINSSQVAMSGGSELEASISTHFAQRRLEFPSSSLTAVFGVFSRSLSTFGIIYERSIRGRKVDTASLYCNPLRLISC
jgi:hypothetical protein